MFLRHQRQLLTEILHHGTVANENDSLITSRLGRSLMILILIQDYHGRIFGRSSSLHNLLSSWPADDKGLPAWILVLRLPK